MALQTTRHRRCSAKVPLPPDTKGESNASAHRIRSYDMNTAFLLMAQYGGKAIIPINDVCRDYFSHLTPTKLIRKIGAGEIAIPLVRIENSQKCAKGVHLTDLAKYLDARTEAARKEVIALTT